MERYIIKFKNESNSELIESFGGKVVQEMPFLKKLVIAEIPKEKIDELKKSNEIDSVEEDEKVEVQNSFYNALFNQKASFGYQIPRLRLNEYWDRGIDGTGVKVLVIDTGTSLHDNLNIAGGISAYSPELSYNFDTSGHGTHVAGCLAARNVGNGGFVGSAPGVELYIAKASGSTEGSDSLFNSGIVNGLNYALEIDADIINCSFSLPSTFSTGLEEAYDAVLAANKILVFASGNSGSETLPEFASREGVLAIGNINYQDYRQSNSSYGPNLSFVCYGTRIIACNSNDPSGFRSASGTSQAAPIFSGIVAMYKQLFPNLTRAELIAKLIENAKLPRSEAEFNNEYGYGIVMPPSELLALPLTKQSLPRGLYRIGEVDGNYYAI